MVISQRKNINHLNNVWKTFGFKIFKDYRIRYLKKNVLLLADVFEKFIKTCIKYYSLDPCRYFSVPGLSWDAMLKMTGVILEKISNPDMHTFIEKEMRGGICVVIQKYCKTNNEFCSEYDSSKSGTEIKHNDMKWIIFMAKQWWFINHMVLLNGLKLQIKILIQH